jgi:hypothetical protein
MPQSVPGSGNFHHQAPSPDLRRFMIAPGQQSIMQELLKEYRGLDTRYSSPNPEKQQATQLFSELRLRLSKEARQYFSDPLHSTPARRTPPEISYPATVSSTLKSLLQTYQGLVFGEVHHDDSSKQLLIELIPVLLRQGVRTLYVEHAQADLHQALLDQYCNTRTSTMPDGLRDFLHAQDHGHATAQQSYYQLYSAAHDQGLRIIALDCLASYHLKGLDHHNARTEVFSFFASHIIRQYQAEPDSGKWVALVGNTHSNRFRNIPGLAELNDGIGINLTAASSLATVIDRDPGVELQDHLGSNRSWVQADLMISSNPRLALEARLSRLASIFSHSPERVQADLRLTSCPVVSEQVLEGRLTTPGTFLISAQPEKGSYELRHRSRSGEIIRTPIVREIRNGSESFLLTRWPELNRHFDSLQALGTALADIMGLRNVWPNLTPQLPQEESTAIAPEEQNKREALLLSERYRLEVQALQSYLAWFASNEERAAYKSGRQVPAAQLARLQAGLEQPQATTASLMNAWLAPAAALSMEQKGALIAAIEQRQRQSSLQLQQQWRQAASQIGAQHILPIAQSRYLSTSDLRRKGFCSALAAQIMAMWLQEQQTSHYSNPVMEPPQVCAVEHYLQHLQQSAEGGQTPSSRVFELGLLEWSLNGSEVRFGTSVLHKINHVAEILPLLEQASSSAAFELSNGQHALGLAVSVRPDGERHYILADPNFAYAEFSTASAFNQALALQQDIMTTLLPQQESAPLLLQQYRPDLMQALLLPGKKPGLRLADLGRPLDLAHPFTSGQPLEQDKTFMRQSERLHIEAFRAQLQLEQGPLAQGRAISRLMRDIFYRHNAPEFARSDRAVQQIRQIRLQHNSAWVQIQADSGLTHPPFEIKGEQHPQDLQILRQYSALLQQLQGTSPSRFGWLRRRTPEIDLQRLALSAALPEDGYLNDQLMTLLSQAAQRTEQEQPISLNAEDHWFMQDSLLQQEARQFASLLTRVSAEMLSGQPHPEEWIPLLDSCREEAEGHSSMAFRNSRQPEQEIRPRLADRRASDIGAKLQQARLSMDQLAQHEIPGAEFSSMHGLNRAFFVQMLMNILRRHQAHGQENPAGTEANRGLTLALTLHDYSNMTQIALGQLEESAQIVRLIQTVIRADMEGIELPGLSLSVLTRAGGMVFQAAGGTLQLLAAGLDIYELLQARTSLAFDSTFGVMLGVGALAGLSGSAIGASIAVGVMPVGALLGGLGIGITALVSHFAAIVQSSIELAAYFAAIAEACQARGAEISGAYAFKRSKLLLHPVAAHAVIIKLDLVSWQIGLDSPLFYRSRGNGSGAGDSRNWVIWAGFQPMSEANGLHGQQQARAHAIDMLARLNIPRQAALPEDGKAARQLILPAIPRFYVNYDYELTPGILTRHDHGLDLMRRLENPEDFYYDYYIFPGEKAMVRPEFEYIDTSIEVILPADQPITLFMQKIEERAIHGLLHYQIRAKRGQTTIKLEYGARLTLEAEAPQDTDWQLYSDAEMPAQIVFHAAGVNINGIQIDIASANSHLQVTLGNGDSYQLDLATQSSTLIAVSAAHKTALEHLKEHVRDITDKQKTSLKRIVLVTDYTLPAGKNQPERTLARAYFDPSDQRLLFVDPRYPDTTLALRHGQQVYFYNHNHTKLLRANLDNGMVLNSFSIASEEQGRRVSQVLRLYRGGSDLMLSDLAQQHIYLLQADQLILLRTRASPALASTLLHQERSNTPERLLSQALNNGISNPGSADACARLPEHGFVVIDVAHEAQLEQRYWLRMGDGALIRAKLPADQEISAAAGLPHNLTLLACMKQQDGQEIAYFYLPEHTTLYRQAGYGQHATMAEKLAFNAGIKSVQDNVLGLQVETRAGLVYQLDAEGQQTLIAVHGPWLESHPAWWQRLPEVAGQARVSLQGLQQTVDLPLTAWFRNGHVVMAAPTLPAATRLLGLDPDGAYAWLFSPLTGTLYHQALPDDYTLQQAFGSTLLCRDLAALPPARMHHTFAGLELNGNTLTVKLQDNTLPPAVQDVEQWLLIPQQAMVLTLHQTDWLAVKRIVIDLWQLPVASGAIQPMQLQLELDNPLALAASRDGNDLQLLDRANGRSLIFTRVFANTRQKAQLGILLPNGQQLALEPFIRTLENPDLELWQMLQESALYEGAL